MIRGEVILRCALAQRICRSVWVAGRAATRPRPRQALPAGLGITGGWLVQHDRSVEFALAAGGRRGHHPVLRRHRPGLTANAVPGLSRCGGVAWGAEPQVVGAAFRCVRGHGGPGTYLVRSPCLLRDDCARGRAPERRGRSSAARTIRRILLLVPRAAPAATDSPTRGRLRRCSPTYAAPRRRAPAGGWLAALQHASWVMPSQLHNESPGERAGASVGHPTPARCPRERRTTTWPRLRWGAPPNPPPPQTAAAS